MAGLTAAAADLIGSGIPAAAAATLPEAAAATIPEALAATAPLAADALAPTVIPAVAGGLEEAVNVAPALASAAEGGSADVLGALGPAITAGTLASADVGTGGLLATSPSSAPLASTPSSAPAASTANTVAPPAAGSGVAATPAASAPPPEITAAGQAASGAPLPSGAQLPDGSGLPQPASGPALGATGGDYGGGGTPDPAGEDDYGGGGGTSGHGILAKLGLGGLNQFASDNKGLLSVAGAGIPLLTSLFTKNDLPGLTGLESTATNNANVGAALESAGTTGVLPAGDVTALTNAQQVAAGGIRSNYATLGLSGSSSEAEDIAASNARISGQTPTLLSQLTSQGIQASGVAGTEEQAAAALEFQQDQEFQKALQSLATNLVLASMPSRLTTTTTTTGA